MSLQKRITLWFTLLTITVLVLFMGFVYFSAYNNRLNEFYTILEKEAITKLNLLLDTDLDAQTLQTIYRENREILYEVEVAIYDEQEQLVYHDAVEIDFVKESPEMFQEIRENLSIRFLQEGWQVLGFVYEHEGKPFFVTAASYDAYGYSKLENIRDTIIISLAFGILFIIILGRYFSKRILKPVTEMIVEAEMISASNLHLRLKEGDEQDELKQLAQTFNQLLERLEKSFDSQKQFVSYVSHELRTPLTAMITELEWALQRDRTIEEYQETIENILSDGQRMAKLLNTLLDFAKANYDRSEVNFKQIRVDEVLLDSSMEVQKNNPEYKIELDFADHSDEEEVLVNANAYLLAIAFSNLMSNACKFSQDHKCTVSISTEGRFAKVVFKDKGIGISKSELDKIFTPFYRGQNRNFAKGSGIGLTLVKKIVDLHLGEIHVQSPPEQGTAFQVLLPLS
ncbi:HAMP domain-containing sensor histidine kinase [Cecembia lonarensis]|uniref:histidine kinase n=1 Tax=Cecembia lonarensis (strain CCUG 58316 / KCTC 22772 / LW9) TaxID=1225176 RepID=K1L0Q7_CECL9|nr:HAMP domain-containing sensor histidine kinase [Cecembia lonarensis]EKB48351.1 Sensor kinase CusS [Cecembia lonarensis LW9]